MISLFVRLDHVAGLRQAGVARDPDPVAAASLAELAGAGGISLGVCHSQNGTQERDLKLLRETVRTVLNVCLPPQEEWMKLVLGLHPDLATLTPAEREGGGMERGLDIEDRRAELQPMIDRLKGSGIPVSILADPSPAQAKAAHRVGASSLLLHAGRFCWAEDGAAQEAELERLVNTAKVAAKLGLAVHAGGGITYQTVSRLAEVPEIDALHVGHSLIARATLVGMGEAVREMLRLLRDAPGRP